MLLRARPSLWQIVEVLDPEARLLEIRRSKGTGAQSTCIGLNQDLFSGDEDWAGIMDALRWK